MELRPFEREIIELVRRHGRRAPSRMGMWIRGHLLDVGEDYVYSMWKKYREFCRYARSIGVRIKEPTYSSFRRTVSALKSLGLVEVSKVEKNEKPFQCFGYGESVKVYYRVRDPNNEAWYRVFAVLKERKQRG